MNYQEITERLLAEDCHAARRGTLMMTEILRILLVESNCADAQRVREMLLEVEAFEFQLLHVSTVDEALSCLSDQSNLVSFSVILLDLSLPDAQEIDKVERLLQVSPDIPIVVMSDLRNEALVIQALQKGAQNYIVKGLFDGQLLVHDLVYTIDMHRMQQQLDAAQAQLRRFSERTQQLEQEKTLLEAIVNSIQEGICVEKPDGQVVLTNPAQRQIWGLEPEGITESPYNWRSRMQIHKPDGSVLTAEELPSNRTLRGEAVTDYELVVCCPNGEQKWLSINGVTIRVSVAGNNYRRGVPSGDSLDAQQQIQLAINTTRDITERKLIEQALRESEAKFRRLYESTNALIELGNRKVLQAAIYDIAEHKTTQTQLVQAKEEAEAGSRAKSEFLATMSHELRTPLNAILGLSQLMRQEIFGSLNDKQKEYVTCIQTSGEHLLALINDILDLSKVEAGKEELTFVPLNIQELCEYCLTVVREQAYERGLKLNLDIDSQAQICIVDERRCKQMLLNLLSNAVKFTLVGEVSLIVRKLPQGITFIVEDTGIGMKSEKLPLLFEPFRQLDSGLNRQFPGTGLGLALTRSLARLHGGDVSVESELGEGSKFTLYLPDFPSEELLFSASPEDSRKNEGLSCSLTGRCRILLVEHDERSAMLLKDYLEVIGHRVEHLTNTTDFLNSVRYFKPDLILMDVNLRGDYTGFDLLAALRLEPDTKKIRVVMVTARAMAGDRELCLEAGADDYLSKPIGIAQLEAILMRYL